MKYKNYDEIYTKPQVSMDADIQKQVDEAHRLLLSAAREAGKRGVAQASAFDWDFNTRICEGDDIHAATVCF
jgi:hypothetical protein